MRLSNYIIVVCDSFKSLHKNIEIERKNGYFFKFGEIHWNYPFRIRYTQIVDKKFPI